MRSIRNQLVTSLAVGVVLLTSVAGAGLYVYMDEVLERGLDAALSAEADAIAGAVHMEDDGQPHLSPAGLTPPSPADRQQGPLYYQVWREDGRTLARAAPGTAPLPSPHRSTRRTGDATLADGTHARVLRLSFLAQPDEDAFDPASTRPAAPRERLTLVVAHDRRSIDRPLAVLLGGLLVAAATVLAGLLVIVTWGVRRGLRPLADVSDLADRIGPASLDVRFPVGPAVPVELRPIGVKLNDLLDRLQAAFDRERRFSAAIAHELRTPVAELRSLCEVTLRWPDDGRAAADAVAEALAIAGEIGSTVENLTLLARCQAGAERLDPRPLCLATTAAAEWGRSRSRAADRALTTRVDLEPPCPVRADPRVLTVVLRNLFANALEHATAGGFVRVHAEPAGDRVTLVIGNSTDRLLPADLPRLTEAFWRKDDARTDRAHVGLGLAIVDAYCRIADVEFQARLTGPAWFEVTLSFAADP